MDVQLNAIIIYSTCLTLVLPVDETGFSTVAGLKNDFRLRPGGEVGGVLPLEKLEVDVPLPFDTKLSVEEAESRRSVRGASCASEKI